MRSGRQGVRNCLSLVGRKTFVRSDPPAGQSGARSETPCSETTVCSMQDRVPRPLVSLGRLFSADCNI
jgi:hypothetical protein